MSQSLTKDFFLLDFIFFLVEAGTDRAETEYIADTVKTVRKKCSIFKTKKKPIKLSKFLLLSFGRVTILTMQQHAL